MNWYIDKTYQLMCEKAFEDIGFLSDTLYCIHKNRVYKVLDEDSFEERDTGYKSGVFLLPFYFKDRVEKRWINDEEIIPLYSQSQLQSMFKTVEESYSIFWKRTSLISSFRHIPYIDKITSSWEALWMGIVMNEIYNKSWNGEDWED